MKKLALLALTALMALPGLPYTWNPIGPDSIHATRLCFNVGLPYWAICADNGMHLYNYSTHDCEFYSNAGLPVVGACYYHPEQALVAMGDGSWSDGIYLFNFETHEFQVVFWAAYPNFLEYHEPTATYWLGTQFGGMYTSHDGLEWTEVDYFSGKSCTCFDYVDEWIVVSELSNLYNIYWSDDSGETWHEADLPIMISDLKYNNQGVLYGIFPDFSDSSGLWLSEDHGNDWQIVFYSDNMSAVGFDPFGNIFVGWAEEYGLALFDQQAPPPGLTFLNDGLPDVSINKIQLNPWMSAPAIFICTDSGAYYSYDYMVGNEELFVTRASLTVYPNPARDKFMVSCDHAIRELSVLTIKGERIFCSKQCLNELTINVNHWNEGVYIIHCTTDAGSVCRKWILSRQD